MTKDEIIEMAVKAGNSYLFDAMQTDFLQRFAALVAEKEREACARVCNELDLFQGYGKTFSSAIRARKP